MTTRVLIVEDEPAIAVALAAALETAGFEVASFARTPREAVSALDRDRFDVAVIDANLCGESAEAVADRLRALKIPFVATSGYSTAQLGDWLGDAPLLGKPFRTQELIATLRKVGQR